MSDHEDTIGRIERDGVTYEVDWCHELDNPAVRDPYTAVLYVNGSQVCDLPLPGFGEGFTSVEQVMQIARETIDAGGIS